MRDWSTTKEVIATVVVALGTLAIVGGVFRLSPGSILVAAVPAVMLGGYVFIGLHMPGPWWAKRSPATRVAVIVGVEAAFLVLLGAFALLGGAHGGSGLLVLSVAFLVIVLVLGALMVVIFLTLMRRRRSTPRGNDPAGEDAPHGTDQPR